MALELCDVADQTSLLHEQPAPTPVTVARTTTTMQRLADDPNGSHLINFPFALMVFILILVGSLVMSAGLIAAEIPPTAVGFLIALLGAALYCGRLADE